MDLLRKTCEYINIVHKVSGVENLESRIAKKVIDENITDEQLLFVKEVFGDGGRMEYVKELITPVSEKEFSKEWTTPTYYHPNSAPLDEVQLYDGNPNWIYIHSEVQGRWGETYWISTNCGSTLKSLPVIKAFKDFDFKVGHFYKVTCTDTIYWGDNKKKYVFDIEEVSEEEYMKGGFLSDAWDNGFYDKCYIQQIVDQYKRE